MKIENILIWKIDNGKQGEDLWKRKGYLYANFFSRRYNLLFCLPFGYSALHICDDNIINIYMIIGNLLIFEILVCQVENLESYANQIPKGEIEK